VSRVVDVPFPTEPPPVPYAGYPADAPTVWVGSLGVVDPWKVVLPLTATVGRSDPGVQPEAGAATIRLLDITSVRRGEQVQIWHGTLLRFTGRVTTIKATQTGGRTITELACLGNLARLAQITIPVVERDEAVERVRVEGILAQLPPLAPIDPIQTMWGNQSHPFVFRREFVTDSSSEPPSVVAALHEVAANTGAVLRELPNGRIVYEALVGRDAVQRSATVSKFQIDDGVGWEKTATIPPATVKVVWGPKPGDPVKPPERPGDLTGIDLDTINVGGWWVGVPGANGPPWLPAGRVVWLSSAADPVTGLAWQLATTQAVAGSESQVWLRQRVGGSWTAWRWQSGGLPRYTYVEFGLSGTIPTGMSWPSAGQLVFTTPVPVVCEIRLHAIDVSLSHPTAIAMVSMGVDYGGPSSTLTFSTQKGYDTGHTVFRRTVPAGTTRFRLWVSAPPGVSYVGRDPQVAYGVDPVRVADLEDVAEMLRDVVPLWEPPEPHHGQWPPQPPAPAPPVDVMGVPGG
jgi:hypothetical protein